MAYDNNTKDASGKSINDYKADYAAAAARNDAKGMKAANDAANAIRTANGGTAQVASNDIAKVQGGGRSGMVTEPDKWDRGTSSSSGGSGSHVSGRDTSAIGSGAVYQGGAGTVVMHEKQMASYDNNTKDASGKSINDYKADYAAAAARNDADAMQAANDAANAIRTAHGDTAQSAKGDIEKVRNGGVSGMVTHPELWDDGDTVAGEARASLVMGGEDRPRATTPTVSPLTNRAPDLQATLDKWLAAAQEQARRQADYAVSQGVNELQRAEEDAKAQFQTQRNQIAATEVKASDNQALYNERRGDRGGIGAAQYDAIANTAAQNQLAVNQAQVKLSTDTARQIADLRAQGEFQKADALLSLSQTYLQQLISIQQWGAEFNLSVDQFNKQLEQWNNEFEVKVADLLGEYRGAQTLASQSLDLQRRAQSFDEEYRTAGLTGIFRGGQTLESRKMLADSGYALAASGVMPSESQRAALQELYGYDANAVDALVQTAKLAEQAKITPSRTQGDSSGEKKTSGISLTTAKEMAEAGHFTEESVEKLRAAGYSDAYLEDQYGYRPNSADSTDVKFGSGISTKAPAGFSRSEWDNVVYVVGRYLKNQQTAEALAYFDSVSERLNKEQWNTLAELFASYNVSAAPPVYY